MVVDTSIEAFTALLTSNAIHHVQFALLQFIFTHQDVPTYGGGISRADAEYYFSDTKQTYGPRFEELRKKGLIYRIGKKPHTDPDTDKTRTIQMWRTVTEFDDEKVKASKKITDKKKLSDFIEEVRAIRDKLPKGGELRKQLNAAIKKARQ